MFKMQYYSYMFKMQYYYFSNKTILSKNVIPSTNFQLVVNVYSSSRMSYLSNQFQAPLHSYDET
jgi:hypothetical protein